MDLVDRAKALKPLTKGLLTWIPGLYQAFGGRHVGGGTGVAAYCYGIWLKHLTLLWQNGMRSIPGTVLELGPGASLGTGLAALLSGSERYVALDAVRLARPGTNAAVLRDLIALFQERAARPAKAWPDYDAYLDARLFPSHILTEERLRRSLAAESLTLLAEDVARLDTTMPPRTIRYGTWSDPDLLGQGEADLVLSHTVLQHVSDLAETYRHCQRWLKPGGWMSHQINFSSHRVTDVWNGHLQYGDRLWALATGRRPYFLNREPCSAHLALLNEHGFEVVALIRQSRSDGLDRSKLAPRWQGISDEDLSCAGAFIQARKR